MELVVLLAMDQRKTVRSVMLALIPVYIPGVNCCVIFVWRLIIVVEVYFASCNKKLTCLEACRALSPSE